FKIDDALVRDVARPCADGEIASALQTGTIAERAGVAVLDGRSLDPDIAANQEPAVGDIVIARFDTVSDAALSVLVGNVFQRVAKFSLE
ncbi:hypothetical protein C1T15_27795, partial [Escherichia coli]